MTWAFLAMWFQVHCACDLPPLTYVVNGVRSWKFTVNGDLESAVPATLRSTDLPPTMFWRAAPGHSILDSDPPVGLWWFRNGARVCVGYNLHFTCMGQP